MFKRLCSFQITNILLLRMCDSDSSISSVDSINKYISQEDYDSESTIIIETNSEDVSNTETDVPIIADIKQITEISSDSDNLPLFQQNILAFKDAVRSEMCNTINDNSFNHNYSNDDSDLDVDAIIKKYTSTNTISDSSNTNKLDLFHKEHNTPIEISSDEDDQPFVQMPDSKSTLLNPIGTKSPLKSAKLNDFPRSSIATSVKNIEASNKDFHGASSNTDSEDEELPRIRPKTVKPLQKDHFHTNKDITELYQSSYYSDEILPVQTSSSEYTRLRFKEDDLDDKSILKDTELTKNFTSIMKAYSTTLDDNNIKGIHRSDSNVEDFLKKGIGDNEADEEMIVNITKEALENNTKGKKRKLSIDKEQRRLEKEAEKIKKREEAEQAKKLKEAIKTTNKNMKPEECMKFITVMLDTEIINEKYGGEILNALQAAEITYKLQSNLLPRTVTWHRKLQTHLFDENEKLTLTSKIVEADQVLLVMNWMQIIELVDKRSLLAHVKSIQSMLLNKKLSLAIYGLENYFRYHKKKKQQEMRSEVSQSTQKTVNKQDKIFSDLPKVGRRQFEFALTELEVFCSCSHRLIESPQDLAMMIAQFTKSIAQAPFKLEKNQKLEAEWYISADNKDCVRVDKDGNGLQRLWQQQLTTFPLARLEHAEAIMAKYPTPASLIEDYDHCTRTEGEKLLQDIQIRRTAGPLTNVRKIGPELSKKIYAFFTAIDGDTTL